MAQNRYLDLSGRAHWQGPGGAGDVKGRLLINPAQIEFVYRAELTHSTIVLTSGRTVVVDLPLDELKALLAAGPTAERELAGVGAP